MCIVAISCVFSERAIQKEDAVIAKYLVETGTDVDTPMEGSRTGLIDSVAGGEVGRAKIFVDLGADVNALNFFKRSPLDLAKGRSREKMRKLLLENGAKCNICDNED